VPVRRAYCSAVDRNVPVRIRSGAAPFDLCSPQDPADLVCLDYQVRCTGWCCPLFSVLDESEPIPAQAQPAASKSRRTNPSARRWIRPT
jgi:hypothetical protein